MSDDRAKLTSELVLRPPSYRGFADRGVESALYGVLQRRFLNEPKECDRILGDLLADLLPGREDVWVLDVGCGNGQCIHHLSERFPGWKFEGVDLRQSAISEARAAFMDSQRVALFERDLFDFEYAPQPNPNAIVRQSVTYAFTDEQFAEALHRFRSWLTPGGIAVLFDMFTPWEQRLTVVEKSLHHPDGHLLMVRPYSQLRELATAAGLEVLEIRPFSYSGGEHWSDPHDLRSYNHEGLTMRGCFNQPQAHAVLVAV